MRILTTGVTEKHRRTIGFITVGAHRFLIVGRFYDEVDEIIGWRKVRAVF